MTRGRCDTGALSKISVPLLRLDPTWVLGENARTSEWVSSYSLMGRRFDTNRSHCENPNRGMNQSDQISDLTSLDS
jgi:hypothetical protein